MTEKHKVAVPYQGVSSTDCWLVVELATPLKNDGVKVSWDDDSQYMGK
jgi:hypothetical protein